MVFPLEMVWFSYNSPFKIVPKRLPRYFYVSLFENLFCECVQHRRLWQQQQEIKLMYKLLRSVLSSYIFIQNDRLEIYALKLIVASSMSSQRRDYLIVWLGHRNPSSKYIITLSFEDNARLLHENEFHSGLTTVKNTPWIHYVNYIYVNRIFLIFPTQTHTHTQFCLTSSYQLSSESRSI